MTERFTVSEDPFSKYRIIDSPSWLKIKPFLESQFPNNDIPEDFKSHLVELVVLREEIINNLNNLESDQGSLQEITEKVNAFGDYHDDLFENSSFSRLVKKITELMSIAG